ncbi:zinc finger BED domain-containing protein 4-like [Nelusetta ayraudi]|uniref:zinc finger BED domain-containing protein 4-like n=1 Tax=Nelusetta ayraudi TaxID=303726 RepID=UPI003F6E9C43
MRGRKRRSFVWKYFEQHGNVVRCMKCKATFKYLDGATTVMMSHIRRVHQADAAQDVAQDVKPPVVAVPCSYEDAANIARLGGVASPAASTSCSTPERDDGERRRGRRSSAWDVFVREDGEVRCTLCDIKLKYCSSTSNMMYHLRTRHPGTLPEAGPAEHSGGGVATALICRMIEQDLLPVSTVGGEGFRELLAHLAPGYKVPSTGDVAQLIEGRVHEMTEELATKLGHVEKVALTADVWSALQGQRYLTAYCSFITEDWRQRSAVLQTHRLPSDSRATPDDITLRLLDTVQAWGLAGKVTVCVHNDNGRDVPSCDHVPLGYVQCFASTLQLAVHDGLSGGDLLRIVVAAGRLAKHFNSNPAAREALELKQLQMCLPNRRLVRSSRARWDTVCEMFECLLEQRWAVKAVLSDRTVTHQRQAQALEMEDNCWQTMENFTPVLSTLRWAATVISTDAEVSISNVYPITFSLIQTHLMPKESDVEQVAEFKRRVQAVLRCNMEVDTSDLASKPALIASMLDPRHKHLSFLTPAGRLAAKVKLHDLVSELETLSQTACLKEEQQEMLITSVTSQVATPSQARSDIKNTMVLLLGDNYSSSYATDAEAQVDYYLRDIATSLDINPLDWWKLNGPRFPKLATLARHYLCIPGVCLPSLLSEAGQTFAQRRTRLSPEDVDMMIFVNRNT